jgi:hypothetical protein
VNNARHDVRPKPDTGTPPQRTAPADGRSRSSHGGENAGPCRDKRPPPLDVIRHGFARPAHGARRHLVAGCATQSTTPHPPQGNAPPTIRLRLENLGRCCLLHVATWTCRAHGRHGQHHRPRRRDSARHGRRRRRCHVIAARREKTIRDAVGVVARRSQPSRRPAPQRHACKTRQSSVFGGPKAARGSSSRRSAHAHHGAACTS